MYKLIRKVLFLFNPEKVHHFTFSFIKSSFKLPFVKATVKSNFKVEDKKLERELFGLTFKNPVGLAAGMDKNALLFDEFSYYGFGFVEIGTVTPKPQAGNPKKRLFRLKEDGAIINRMGFNNEGVDSAVKRLKKKKTDVIIGGNIGKNKVTPNENAIDDYIICFNKLFDVVDYFVVNVSSPNTPNLRDLQEKEPLTKLLNTLQLENIKKSKRKPILLKIAPDLTDTQLLDIIDIVKTTKIDGVIATNTTISRDGLQSENKTEVGGLSGKPLTNRSTEVIRFLADKSDKAFPIIGVGGIHSAQDALEKIKAGADLVQVYTGFIYEGPKLVKQINRLLAKT
ncbi:quinone-dependent dihydroorotate dehydrogenase [Aureibaculum sp. 2210JD6-5]|uniref:quinone-dependent dihydroorotate dehydrogenase n=1 Tax=Aureibaculum sp. 2210JD6-5 TaxID=3103957 RepID=UPI002AAD2A08|nr:quinone-dependent dihydroorotate dehydrogenase [Aureibaculum sp. 2210JD6-5]MDY7395139.1 quinone-dependent dihydroorotate dehydrogenase [Aureibaculum sp. 2210JD6-5]